MKSTKTAEWTTEDGRNVNVEVELTKSVSDDISFADGWNINHGKKTYEGVDVKIFVNGKRTVSSWSKPELITKTGYGRDYETLIKKGAYARISDTYINQKTYDAIMSLIAEATEECNSPEFEAVKAEETAKELKREEHFEKLAEEQQKLIDSGMCPKCGSWCYGDCKAH